MWDGHGLQQWQDHETQVRFLRNGDDIAAQNQQQEEVILERQRIIVGFLIGTIFILSLTLLFLTGPLLWRYLKRKMPVSQKRINRRYDTIERWLISKRVRGHDHKCKNARVHTSIESTKSTSTTSSEGDESSSLSDVITEPSLQNVSSESILVESTTGAASPPDSDDDDMEQASTVSQLECSICLEPFVADEVVSWSTNTACPHVFHHECIKEWLLRRAGCPFCRTPLLAVDCKGSARFTEKQLEAFIDQWRRRMLSTYFCLQDGLVVLENPAREMSDLTPDGRDLVLPRVKREDLEKKRGPRIVENTESSDHSDVCDS